MTRRRIASRGLHSGMGHATEKGWLAQFPNVGCKRHVLGRGWAVSGHWIYSCSWGPTWAYYVTSLLLGPIDLLPLLPFILTDVTKPPSTKNKPIWSPINLLWVGGECLFHSVLSSTAYSETLILKNFYCGKKCITWIFYHSKSFLKLKSQNMQC